MNRIVFLAPVIAFIALVGFFGIGLTKDPKELPSQLIDRPLPTFDLPGIAAAPGGGPGLASVTLKGEPALLNIFASWCIPCAVEAPQLAQLRAQGIDVVGVAIRDKPDELKIFLQRNGNPFTRIGADDVSAIQFAVGSSGVPESFVIDGKGTIRYQHIGDIRADQVEMIAQKVREAGQ